MRLKVLEISAPALVALLKAAGRLPADARAVGGPALDEGRALVVVASAEFPEAEDGRRFPRERYP